MKQLTNLIIDEQKDRSNAIEKGFKKKMTDAELEKKEEETGEDLDGDGEKGESKEHKKKIKEAKKKKEKKVKKSFGEMILEKAHVRAHLRKTKSGKLANVKEHEAVRKLKKKLLQDGYLKTVQMEFGGKRKDFYKKGKHKVEIHQNGSIGFVSNIVGRKYDIEDFDNKTPHDHLTKLHEKVKELVGGQDHPKANKILNDIEHEKGLHGFSSHYKELKKQLKEVTGKSYNEYIKNSKKHLNKRKEKDEFSVQENDDRRSKKYLKKLKFHKKLSDKYAKLVEKEENAIKKHKELSEKLYSDAIDTARLQYRYKRKGDEKKSKKYEKLSEHQSMLSRAHEAFWDKSERNLNKIVKKLDHHSEKADRYYTKLDNRRYDNENK